MSETEETAGPVTDEADEAAAAGDEAPEDQPAPAAPPAG